jgi:outer membrane murein-binding lipoprotein Lpp
LLLVVVMMVVVMVVVVAGCANLNEEADAEDDDLASLRQHK